MDEIVIERAAIEQVQILQEIALKAYSDHYLHLWHDGGDWYTQTYFSVGRLTEELSDKNARFYIPY